MAIQVNDTIILKNNLRGTIRYIGYVEGREEEWVGIELDEPRGSNDGEVDGIRYFDCEENHGLFVKYQKLTMKMTTIDRSGVNPMKLGEVNASGMNPSWVSSVKLEDPMKLDGVKLTSPIKLTSSVNSQNTLSQEKRKAQSETLEKCHAIEKFHLESLKTIQGCLERLQRKVDALNLSCKRPVDAGEREVLIELVSGMIEMEKTGDRKGMASHLKKFKDIMAKHKIKVE